MWCYAISNVYLKALLLFLAVMLAIWLSPRRVSWVGTLKHGLRKLSQRPWTCAMLLFAVSITLSATLSVLRNPAPWIHDEFSYLLASDTFAHGRVSNPPHPMWIHFETFHVLQQPSYMSKYPPANGMALAVGQVLTGAPIVGAWLSLALACVALYWMFRAWMPAHWAALGGLLMVMHAPMLRVWGQTYWGGAIALLGGALVLGGMRRIIRMPRIKDSCLFAAGFVLLANSRPLECALLSIPVFAVLLAWLIRRDVATWLEKTKQFIVPVSTIGGLGLAGLATYNVALTHAPLTLPYKLHDKTYSASSLLFWSQPPEPPLYHHARMQAFYVDWARARQITLRSSGYYLELVRRKVILLWDFFPLAAGLGLFAIPWIWKDRWMKFALATLLVVILLELQLATSWLYPHYLAPLVPLFFVASIKALRQIRIWNRRWAGEPIFGRAVVCFAVLQLAILILQWAQPGPINPRQQVANDLHKVGGQHLVIVSYEASYDITRDWVYNAADVDAAEIVWARDMGTEQNQELIEYFAGRNVWRWNLADQNDFTLSAYREGDPVWLAKNGKAEKHTGDSPSPDNNEMKLTNCNRSLP